MTHNGGQWTEARFRSFIKGGLRGISLRWPPKSVVKKAARIRRGVYKCAGYGKRAHQADASIKEKGKRVNNIFVDHITPVIGEEGFVSWDQVIERMFCEADGLQVLCRECHQAKTKDERQARKNNKNV
jgi:hypothetical protein